MQQSASPTTATPVLAVAPAAEQARPRLAERFSAPRQPRQIHLLFAALLVASALAHAVVLRNSHGASFDMESYKLQGQTVLQHVNVYTLGGPYNRYPYPPVWIWVMAAVSLVSAWLHVSFEQVARLPAIAGDLAITVLMYRYVYERRGPRLTTLLPVALFALNPVAWLISAGHGQFDPLVIACLLLALVLRGASQDLSTLPQSRLVLSALAVGMAIALKGYPVLVLPYVVLTAPQGWRLRTLALACLPTLVSELLYGTIFGFTPNMVTRVLSYRSTAAMGWLAVLRATPLEGMLSVIWAGTVAPLLPVAVVVAVSIWCKRLPSANAVALIFTAFYATTLTMSVQYILWVLPFLCIALPVGALLYSVVAFATLNGFYSSHAVEVIPRLPLWQSSAPEFVPYLHVLLAAFIAVSALLALALRTSPAQLNARA